MSGASLDAKVRSTSTPPKTARRSRRNASGVRASAASAPSATSHVATYSFSTAARGESSLCVRAPSEEKRRRPDVSASRRPTGCALRGATAARSGRPRSSLSVLCTPMGLWYAHSSGSGSTRTSSTVTRASAGTFAAARFATTPSTATRPCLTSLLQAARLAATDASLRNLSSLTVDSALAVVVAHATRSRRIWALCTMAKTSLNFVCGVAAVISQCLILSYAAHSVSGPLQRFW